MIKKLIILLLLIFGFFGYIWGYNHIGLDNYLIHYNPIDRTTSGYINTGAIYNSGRTQTNLYWNNTTYYSWGLNRNYDLSAITQKYSPGGVYLDLQSRNNASTTDDRTLCGRYYITGYNGQNLWTLSDWQANTNIFLDLSGSNIRIVASNGIFPNTSSNFDVPINNWFNLCVQRYKYTTKYRYEVRINGASQIMVTDSINYNATNDIIRPGTTIVNNATKLLFLIDDVVLYKKKLTSDEIYNLYNSNLPVFEYTGSSIILLDSLQDNVPDSVSINYNLSFGNQVNISGSNDLIYDFGISGISSSEIFQLQYLEDNFSILSGLILTNNDTQETRNINDLYKKMDISFSYDSLSNTDNLTFTLEFLSGDTSIFFRIQSIQIGDGTGDVPTTQVGIDYGGLLFSTKGNLGYGKYLGSGNYQIPYTGNFTDFFNNDYKTTIGPSSVWICQFSDGIFLSNKNCIGKIFDTNFSNAEFYNNSALSFCTIFAQLSIYKKNSFLLDNIYNEIVLTGCSYSWNLTGDSLLGTGISENLFSCDKDGNGDISIGEGLTCPITIIKNVFNIFAEGFTNEYETIKIVSSLFNSQGIKNKSLFGETTIPNNYSNIGLNSQNSAKYIYIFSNIGYWLFIFSMIVSSIYFFTKR